MKVSVITRTPSEKKREVEVGESSSLRALQKRLGLGGQVFVTKLNDRLAHPESALKEGDCVEFIGIIYGG